MAVNPACNVSWNSQWNEAGDGDVGNSFGRGKSHKNPGEIKPWHWKIVLEPKCFLFLWLEQFLEESNIKLQ